MLRQSVHGHSIITYFIQLYLKIGKWNGQRPAIVQEQVPVIVRSNNKIHLKIFGSRTTMYDAAALAAAAGPAERN